MLCTHQSQYKPVELTSLADGNLVCPLCVNRCRGCGERIGKDKLDDHGFCEECADPNL